MGLACLEGHLPIVLVLLALGVDPNARNPEDGTFPLRIACQKGFLRIVKALLSAGADPAMTMEDDDATSALYIASFNGHAAIVRALLDAGADHRAVTSAGWTALDAAVDQGHDATVAALLAHPCGSDVLAHTTATGHSPLLTACLRGHTSIASLLLAYGADMWQVCSINDGEHRFVTCPFETALTQCAHGFHAAVADALWSRYA